MDQAPQRRGCESSGEVSRGENSPGERKPIEPHLKYGPKGKSDDERFDCQRYAANAVKGFLNTVDKLRKKGKV